MSRNEDSEIRDAVTDGFEAGLYLVPVPIGNLDDITLRALKVLRRADIIACEDTRMTGKLLQRYSISPRSLISYHDHSEDRRDEMLLEHLRSGKVLALVSDAGSPLISDPGYRLVRKAGAAGIPVVPLPGATAFVPALMASGLPTTEFSFMGFPPHKKGRRRFVERILAQPDVVVLYESPHRIQKLLQELCDGGGRQRPMALCRELSKKHEQIIRGTALQCLEWLGANGARGEFVVVVGPENPPADSESDTQ